ncbi:MAG: hypothetical protein U9O55_01400 [Patescibacteria group bacterium]|nr:hypothetical protein [Patescibacteria group bacterium]
MKKTKNLFLTTILIFSFLFVCFLPTNFSSAEVDDKDVVLAIYFTGIGCSHCAKVDPIIFEQSLTERDNFAVIEYEIYQDRNNAPLFDQCCDNLDLPACRPFGPTPCKGIPLISFSNEHSNILTGDKIILKELDNKLSTIRNNHCSLLGDTINFSDLDFNNLPGSPKIWMHSKILIRNSDTNFNSAILKDLLLADNVENVLRNKKYNKVEPRAVSFSGGKTKFDNAISLGGWIFQWNGNSIDGAISENQNNNYQAKEIKNELTIFKIISLALVDAINPCALAAMLLMLTAILAYNPKNRKNIILAGLAFVFSIFVMYFLYGLIIIKFFQIIQSLTEIRIWVYKFLGLAAIILGVLNIKDFFGYKPGTLGTEMPIFMRPKFKKIISGITSPKGAFGVGIFVTLFLLPCTIGPYIIAGGMLSMMDIFKTILPLLLYNFIFILPMLAIIGFVYLGFKNVKDVDDWKEKNIHKLHLVAGLIMFGLGVSMVIGLV